jgi:CHAT domain-containing protein
VLVIAGGEQLEHARTEADYVAREYHSSVVLKDEQARLDAVRKGVADADVIHFAGHAIGDDSGLVPASILLSGGRVEAPEISHLSLRRTSVVVLAGCGTARGARRGMEGVISVAHGFLAGGAPSVIATLWPIDDTAAAEFFPRLHRRLAEGLPPAEALREAQLESIRRGDVPASLWAAIQDIGS